MRRQFIYVLVVIITIGFSSCNADTDNKTSIKMKNQLHEMYLKQLSEWKIITISNQEAELVSPFKKDNLSKNLCYRYKIFYDPMNLTDFSTFLSTSEIKLEYVYKKESEACTGTKQLQTFDVESSDTLKPDRAIAKVAINIIEKKWLYSDRDIVLNTNDSCLLKSNSEISLTKIQELDTDNSGEDIGLGYRADILCGEDGQLKKIVVFVFDFANGEKVTYEFF